MNNKQIINLNSLSGLSLIGASIFLVACIAQDPTEENPTSSESSSSVVQNSSSSLASVDWQYSTLVPDPSWNCGLDTGLVPPTEGELVFSASIKLGDIHAVGETPYGNRTLLDVEGGSLNGSRIQGEFLKGGIQLELELANGALELEQIDILRTNNGTHILMHSCGFAPSGATSSHFVPRFEAPNNSNYNWLHNGKYAGVRTVNELSGTVDIEVYDISNVSAGYPELQLQDPAGTPNQPSECLKLSGARGNEILSETVSLGSSISIGASQFGSRNIIPITGGNFSGRLNGTVLFGGADYQLTGNNGGSTVLDARYTLKTDDNEYILVRNCGPFGALVPLFETRKEGPYAYLNENRFLSSDPGFGGGGGVGITFYELR